MRDFTQNILIHLLNVLKKYYFQTFNTSLTQKNVQFIILRHDIDKLPVNALEFAEIQHKMGVKGSYYFRIVPQSFNPEIIGKIAELGHEIGYHYEDVDLVYKREKGRGKRQKIDEEELIDRAYESFCENLEKLRELYPVKTICMHGSPLSPYDNRMIWKKYDYRDLGIIGEPYFDIDFNQVFYLTDTGRRWDGEGVSVRDKVKGKSQPGGQIRQLAEEKTKDQNLKFRSTNDIIKAADEGRLPDKMMITIHPQRWHDSFGPWLKELVWQNSKNVVKKYFYVK